MANYKDFDEAFDTSQVEYGVGEGRESIRTNLRSTNGAAYRTEAAVNALRAELAELKAFVTQQFQYQNQGDGKGTDNLFSSVNATNGEVYRQTARLNSIEQKLTELIDKANVAASNAPAAKNTSK